jgi:hypothetical protein
MKERKYCKTFKVMGEEEIKIKGTRKEKEKKSDNNL